MRPSRSFEHRPWFIVPVIPNAEKRYLHWNIVLISALVFIVIGVFVMTVIPDLGHLVSGTSVSQKAPVAGGANHAD
jgi:hypothetical protein